MCSAMLTYRQIDEGVANRVQMLNEHWYGLTLTAKVRANTSNLCSAESVMTPILSSHRSNDTTAFLTGCATANFVHSQ